jgi:hypothetical protein
MNAATVRGEKAMWHQVSALNFCVIIGVLVYVLTGKEARLKKRVTVRRIPTLTSSMTDDPNKRYKDRNTVSWQDWEIDHLVDHLCRDFPKRPRPVIEKVIKDCTETIRPSEGRERLIDCARRNLS